SNAKAQRILIDHHQEPQTEKFAYGASDTSKSSTCEMVYDFIEAAGYDEKINIAVAECLYTGVMTDTGSFRFPSTTSSVHSMVANLKSKGL
ncbi:DHH family phosphoesterase, partial [Klebsiella aerogenes]|uniref:DHH family phosphoesterase n=1 Tax=Klebsiella aerogenes TaxID=548 RepID=UPI001CC5B5A1